MTTNKEKPAAASNQTDAVANANSKHEIDTDDSSLASLRLPQNFEQLIGGTKLIQQIPVRRPEKQWFIRTHHNPEMWFYAAILDFKEDREAYIVDNSLWQELATEVAPKVLIPSMTTHGHAFLWPIRLPAEDGRIDDWNRSALAIAEVGKKHWARVISNMAIGSYEALQAATLFPDPTWPDYGLDEWIRLGFRDRIIKSTDHPVVRRLRGEQ